MGNDNGKLLDLMARLSGAAQPTGLSAGAVQRVDATNNSANDAERPESWW